MADAKMITKATVCEILNHWLLTVSFFILAASGFGFLFQMSGVGALFGGFNQMRIIHNWSGVVFMISLLLTMFNYVIPAKAGIQHYQVLSGFLFPPE